MHKSHSNLISEQDNFSPYVTSMVDNPDYTTTTTTVKEKGVENKPEDIVKIKDKESDLEIPVLEPLKAEKIELNIPKTVEIAKDYLGKPYVYGSQGPNTFDCSGFIRFLFSKVGKISDVNDFKTLPRTASGIYSSPNVTKINFDEIAPGDLVFFKDKGKISHIGLISDVETNANNEKVFHMVHASSSSGIQDTESTNYTKNGVNKSSYWANKIYGYGDF
jgi:hypothetical protein